MRGDLSQIGFDLDELQRIVSGLVSDFVISCYFYDMLLTSCVVIQ